MNIRAKWEELASFLLKTCARDENISWEIGSYPFELEHRRIYQLCT